MLIDVVLVVVLGAALAWLHRAQRAQLTARARAAAGSAHGFITAAARSRFGVVFALLLTLSLLRWAAHVAAAGWESLDPAVATGERSEQDACHRHQRRLRTGGLEAFARPERVCPAGGGAFEVDAAGGLRCPVHGAAP